VEDATGHAGRGFYLVNRTRRCSWCAEAEAALVAGIGLAGDFLLDLRDDPVGLFLCGGGCCGGFCAGSNEVQAAWAQGLRRQRCNRRVRFARLRKRDDACGHEHSPRIELECREWEKHHLWAGTAAPCGGLLANTFVLLPMGQGVVSKE
jgi:hypothetical protein